MHGSSNCWICEGWSEYLFEYVAPVVIDATTPVKLHVSCDEFKGELLAYNEQRSNALTEA